MKKQKNSILQAVREPFLNLHFKIHVYCHFSQYDWKGLGVSGFVLLPYFILSCLYLVTQLYFEEEEEKP